MLSYMSLSSIQKYSVYHNSALWRIYVADNNKTYSALRVKGHIFLSNLNQIWILSTDFHNVPNIKFHVNPSSGSRADRRGGQTDRREHDKTTMPLT